MQGEVAIALKLPYYHTLVSKYSTIQQFQLKKLHRGLIANHNVRTPVKCRDNDCDNRDYYDDYDNEDDDNDEDDDSGGCNDDSETLVKDIR